MAHRRSKRWRKGPQHLREHFSPINNPTVTEPILTEPGFHTEKTTTPTDTCYPARPRKVTDMERAELFLFSSDIIKFSETDKKEINATYENMEQLGIANMPYPLTDIGINGYLHDLKNGEKGYFIDNYPKDTIAIVEVRFRYKSDSDSKHDDIMVKLKENWHDVHALVSVKSPEHLKKYCATYHEQAERFRKTLIVLLATRGVIKTRTKDKLLAMGLGRRRLRDNMRPIYTTTLTLPIARSEPHPHKGSLGVSKRPHLRRGHPRDQRHGPNFEYVKKIWVEPCFVNADENFVSSRFSYNASKKDDQVNPPERMM